MEKENHSINLLSTKDKTSADIFLFWALYVGRLLVIITEAIALFVFLSRFSIDRKLIDYSDAIKKQQTFVHLFKQGEEKFRNTQLKLKISKDSTSSSAASFDLFQKIMRRTDSDISFSALTITPDSLSVTATSSTSDSLAVLTNDLKNHPRIASLSIDKVESKPKSALISITISAKLRESKK